MLPCAISSQYFSWLLLALVIIIKIPEQGACDILVTRQTLVKGKAHAIKHLLKLIEPFVEADLHRLTGRTCSSTLKRVFCRSQDVHILEKCYACRTQDGCQLESMHKSVSVLCTSR